VRQLVHAVKWLTRMFTPRPRPIPAPASRVSSVDRAAESVGTTDSADTTDSSADEARVSGLFSAEEEEFLEEFLDPPHPRRLDEVETDDRLFLAGIRKRWHERRLELPVLPAAAIRLREMLRGGDVPVARYVELIETDSALHVEVLKAANSAFFAAGAPVTSTDSAILRMGLRRIESLLLMVQLRTKVLKGGAVQGKAELLMEMAPPLTFLASHIARHHPTQGNLSFIRGMLLHVEHLVILGAVADVSRDYRRSISPSVRALHEAFVQFGLVIRQAVAAAWTLQEILIGGQEDGNVADEYAGFRRAIICRWVGRPVPELPDVNPALLGRLITSIPPRVVHTGEQRLTA